jgi:hypothetical protein
MKETTGPVGGPAAGDLAPSVAPSGPLPVLAPLDVDIASACTAYMVLLVSHNGRYLRKPYLSLRSAQQALQRANDRGQQAWLVLCRLEPITADLELGEWSS